MAKKLFRDLVEGEKFFRINSDARKVLPDCPEYEKTKLTRVRGGSRVLETNARYKKPRQGGRTDMYSVFIPLHEAVETENEARRQS